MLRSLACTQKRSISFKTNNQLKSKREINTQPTKAGLPVPILFAHDPNRYSNFTLTKRTPKAINKLISETEAVISLANIKNKDLDKALQGQIIVEKLLGLRFELENNAPIRPLSDALPDIGTWNERLRSLGKGVRYLDAPMLYSECYVFRSIAGIHSKFSRWRSSDWFQTQKRLSFQSCKPDLERLASCIPTRINGLEDFRAVLRFSLWGNQGDLAFSVSKLPKFADPLSKDELIVADDSKLIWEKISGRKNLRVDIILDNAGGEVLGDLMLADSLLRSGMASKVHLHGKKIPWFVSDTTLPDLQWLLEDCLDSTVLNKFAVRCLQAIRKGELIYETDWFWTSPHTYWDLPAINPSLFTQLNSSDWLVFKGDLNYRKLIGDGLWPYSTPFYTAIGPFGGGNSPLVTAMKTCKSEPLPAIEQKQTDLLDKLSPDWRWDGQHAVIHSNIRT